MNVLLSRLQGPTEYFSADASFEESIDFGSRHF